MYHHNDVQISMFITMMYNYTSIKWDETVYISTLTDGNIELQKGERRCSLMIEVANCCEKW